MTTDSSISRVNAIVANLVQTAPQANVQSLVMMGSHGAGEPTQNTDQKGSDIDILCLVQEQAELSESVQAMKDHFKSALLTLTHNKKLVVYLQEPFIKLDLMFAHKLESCSRYLRGSEECRVLWTRDDKDFTKLSEELRVLMSTKAVDDLPEYSMHHHRQTFVEYLELLCKSIVRQDEYRVEFYIFLLRHCLVCLARIQAGCTQHLYLPKQALKENTLLQGLPLRDGRCMMAQGKALAQTYYEHYLKLIQGTASGTGCADTGTGCEDTEQWWQALIKYYFD